LDDDRADGKQPVSKAKRREEEREREREREKPRKTKEQKIGEKDRAGNTQK